MQFASSLFVFISFHLRINSTKAALVLHWNKKRSSSLCVLTFSSSFFDRLWGPSSLLCNGQRGFFPRGKAVGAWSWPLSAEVGNAWAITSFPQYVILAWCLVEHRDGYLYLYHVSLKQKHELSMFPNSPVDGNGSLSTLLTSVDTWPPAKYAYKFWHSVQCIMVWLSFGADATAVLLCCSLLRIGIMKFTVTYFSEVCLLLNPLLLLLHE